MGIVLEIPFIRDSYTVFVVEEISFISSLIPESDNHNHLH